MSDYYLHQSATFQSRFDNNDGLVLNYIDANSGCTRSEIATGISRSAAIVDVVVEVLSRSNLVVFGYDETGAEGIWTAEDWAGLLKSNLAGARTWLASNDGGVVSDMATDLSIDFAIAAALGWHLEHEASGKITAVVG